jgi:hypothetical protein
MRRKDGAGEKEFPKGRKERVNARNQRKIKPAFDPVLRGGRRESDPELRVL